MRIWFLREPAPLVTGQGRINIVNTAGNYIVVDGVGSDLTTEADQLNSYVNIIDAQTGNRKASFQIKNISGTQISFKASPARSTVLNTTIDTDMSSLTINDATNEGADIVIEPDDFICILRGSCVPFFKKPFSNFLIQYAVAEIRRKLGGAAELEQQVLQKLEEQVERSWVGREQTLRVKKANDSWSQPVRRYFGGN